MNCHESLDNSTDLDRARREIRRWPAAGFSLLAFASGAMVVALLAGNFSALPVGPADRRGELATQASHLASSDEQKQRISDDGKRESDASSAIEAVDSLPPRIESVSLDRVAPGVNIQELAEIQASPLAVVAGPWPAVKMKHVIGATTTILESQTELSFQARVDTGAKSCSMHVEKIVIAGAAEEMDNNIGKRVRFKVKNMEGESDWIKSVIDRCINVKTSDSVERRYKVPLLLRWNGLAKSVLVTLNDRTQMKYPLLLGRNFLEADFVVDIELDSEL